MYIKSVRIYGIRSPLIEPFIISYGIYPDLPAVIVKIETNDGQVGYGEGVPDQCVTGETVESTYAVLKNELASEVIGLSPFQIEEAHQRFNLKVLGSTSAKAALDLAMYDLMGKITGQPVYNLLGGKAYKNLLVPQVISIKEPIEMAEDALRFVNTGFRSIKIKVGADDWQKDVERINHVRKAIGDTQMRVDVNQGWKDRATSMQAIEKIKDCDLDWVEQPVTADDLEALAEVKHATPVRIMVDEGVHDIKDLLKVIQLRAADVVNIKLMKAGGLYPALAIAYMAEAAGMTCQVGSMVETAIGTAAGAHLAISRSVIKSNELVGPLMFSLDVGGKLDFKGDVLTLSDRPGFGLDVDEKVITDLSFAQDKLS